MKILRIFPRKTKVTPDDENVRIGSPNLFDEADKVLISISFTWDMPKAEILAEEWQRIAPVEIGGPAYQRGNGFELGQFLKLGNTITSRGCPNKCWFCSVWKRDGNIRELKIQEGNIIQDDNLLACSDQHIRNVFKMLKIQKGIEFKGGLEAKRLKDWHINEMTMLSIKQMFFAYDTSDDLEPLMVAGKKLQEAGFNRNKLRCYVLIGYKSDTFDKAKSRLKQSWDVGFLPFAMLYTKNGEYNKEWRKFQRLYARPAITKKLLL